MVVDDIEEYGETIQMAGVDQTLQSMRSAIAVLRRIGVNAVIAPVARSRKLPDRHQLEGRDTQITQCRQAGDDRFECAFRGEGPDVEFVEHQIFSRHSGPALIRPSEFIGAEDGRCLIHTVWLPARGGVWTLRTSV